MDKHLPLTEVTFFILVSLAPGAKHGYAIMQDVAHLSNGRVTLSTGTLYGALKRLLEQGWIGRIADETADKSGRPRKVYDLTDLGRRILKAETSRLQQASQLAQARMTGGLA